jgi:RNA-binding protein
MDLTDNQRPFLRAQGHSLKPKVWVGKQGIGPALVSQVDVSLTSHELIKVKLLESCPLEIADCADALAAATRAATAQTIGRTILLYRPHPEHPVIQLPSGTGVAGATASHGTRTEAASRGER